VAILDKAVDLNPDSSFVIIFNLRNW
jgi:hypothetical protein